jgi:hypothetical protein
MRSVKLYGDGMAMLETPYISSYLMPNCTYAFAGDELLIYADIENASGERFFGAADGEIIARFSVEDENTIVFETSAVPLVAETGARYVSPPPAGPSAEGGITEETKEPASPTPEPKPQPTGTIPERPVIEDIAGRVVAYYPEGVSFEYLRRDRIADETNPDGFVEQECYLFNVLYEGETVSGVAVGTEDGKVWFKDMYGSFWLSESFMGLPPDAETAARENAARTPFVEIMSRDENGASMYFALIDAIPELSGRNEGTAYWDETTQTLTVSAVKNTGSVSGTADGPTVSMVVTWANGEPELVSVEYEPAPIFSQPSQVLSSGEVMEIPEERLIEIAVYLLKKMFEEDIKSYLPPS